MKRILASLFIGVLAMALPAAAQMAPKTISHVLYVTAKSGMHSQFEAGVKKLRVWQKEHNYPYASQAWVVITGKREGEYVFVTGGRDWKDFDESAKFGEGESKVVAADIAPYVDSVVGSFWRVHPDLSAHPPQAGHTPPQFISVTTYYLQPGGEASVEHLIKQVNEAIKKTQWPAPPNEWYSLVNGGMGSQFAHVTGHQDWASFAPPQPSFEKMLTEAYGKEGSTAIFHKFVKNIKTWRTEIYRYQSELSYTPAMQ